MTHHQTELTAAALLRMIAMSVLLPTRDWLLVAAHLSPADAYGALGCVNRGFADALARATGGARAALDETAEAWLRRDRPGEFAELQRARASDAEAYVRARHAHARALENAGAARREAIDALASDLVAFGPLDDAWSDDDASSDGSVTSDSDGERFDNGASRGVDGGAGDGEPPRELPRGLLFVAMSDSK